MICINKDNVLTLGGYKMSKVQEQTNYIIAANVVELISMATVATLHKLGHGDVHGEDELQNIADAASGAIQTKLKIYAK